MRQKTCPWAGKAEPQVNSNTVTSIWKKLQVTESNLLKEPTFSVILRNLTSHQSRHILSTSSFIKLTPLRRIPSRHWVLKNLQVKYFIIVTRTEVVDWQHLKGINNVWLGSVVHSTLPHSLLPTGQVLFVMSNHKYLFTTEHVTHTTRDCRSNFSFITTDCLLAMPAYDV